MDKTELLTEHENKTISYSQTPQPYHQIVASLVQDYSSDISEPNVLELGCGPGNVLKCLEDLKFVCEMHIADIDMKCLEICERSFRVNESVLLASSDKLLDKLPANYHDVIISSHVLHYENCPLERLREIAMLLKGKGILVLAIPNIVTPSIVLKSLFGSVRAFGVYSWDRSTLLNLINRVGDFEILEWKNDFVPLPVVSKFSFFTPFSKALVSLAPNWAFSHILVLKKI